MHNHCNQGVLDSGLHEEYSYSLQNQVIKKTTNASVVFGGGEKVLAKYSLTIPVQIGDNVSLINTVVIDGKLRLLLSVNSMRKASVVLDFQSGTARVMSGIPVKLSTSSTGHLLLDISCFQASPVVDLCFVTQALNRDQICKLLMQLADLKNFENWKTLCFVFFEATQKSPKIFTNTYRMELNLCQVNSVNVPLHITYTINSWQIL